MSDNTIEPEPGYYWVILEGKANWVPVLWTGAAWYLVDEEGAWITTSDIRQIGPNIEPPKEAAW